MRALCESCKSKQIVEPAGPLGAEVLLVGEFPGWEEIRSGLPFVGRTGEVLREELSRIGIPFMECRMTNLWLHEKDKDCDIDYHVRKLVEEMQGKKYILLMGSDVSKTLFNTGVMELTGLRVTSKYIPKKAIAVVTPNPASLFKGRVGEFRMALVKFRTYMED